MLTKKISWIICLFLTVGSLMFPVLTHAFDIRLGTGSPGSFSYFSGRVLCRMINTQVADLNCQQVAVADDVYNLTNLHDGSLDIILADSRPLLDAINKTGNFEFLDISYDNLRALAPLYDVPITLVVRNDAGINSLTDLKGKRINAGAPGSPQYLAMNRILNAKKWTKDDFSLVGDLSPSQSNDDTKAFCYGTMQAMVYIGIHPDFSLRRLLKTCNGDLLNMDDNDIATLVNADPALWKIELPAGTYPSHPKKVTTFGTRAMLVASEDLDQETVYKIIAAIDNNKKYLVNTHQSLGLFSKAIAQKSAVGLQLHPGAAKYFAEH
ncbi:MAG: TAXI family TRAP transporter solute-binding subunit [Desulfuromusa sp.]